MLLSFFSRYQANCIVASTVPKPYSVILLALLLHYLRTIYLWNWMFPLLMTRCDMTSVRSPVNVVTMIPN